MCFKEYIQDSTNIEPIYPIGILSKDIVNEAHISSLLSNTDEERLRKAEEEVRTNPPKVYSYNDGTEKLEFNFKSFPSTEMKRHKGFIVHKEGEIQKLYCDCKDFYYRLWTPLVEAGLSTFTLSTRFITDRTKNHTQSWTDKTNPDGNLYICKHLASLKKYI